ACGRSSAIRGGGPMWAGTGSAPLLQPGDVARAVGAAVDRPRFEITVPAYIGPLTRMAELLPQAMRDRLFAAMVPDQVAEVRAEARAGYEGSFTIARPPRTGVGD